MSEPAPFAGSPLIALSNLDVTLSGAAGPVHILRGLDFQVAAGETVGVVGPSGSGKTTLIMAIAGLENTTNGSLTVANQNLSDLDEDARARFRRDHVGIIFQSFHLMQTMTALENVALPLELAGQSDPFAAAEEALKSVGLGPRVGHYPSQLSGGEQQRVALARAIVNRPRLLLADEPTGNLDQGTGASIIELLFNLREAHGSTLVLITHDPGLARRCDRVVHMQDGRLFEDQAA